MACPFFVPTEPLNGGLWPHPARLPLGRGWIGVCAAGAESVRPNDEDLTHHCNLGYARCGRLPKDRDADAIRFSVAAASGSSIVVDFVCERDHLPGAHGRLHFDSTGECADPHLDLRIRRLASCFVAGYIERKRNGANGDAGDDLYPGLFDSSAGNS